MDLPPDHRELPASWQDGPETRSFASLHDFRPSGWERHGVEAAPELRAPARGDDRATPGSPAASGGVGLAATGGPEARASGYRGTLDPRVATVLGAVGLSAGTRCAVEPSDAS